MFDTDWALGSNPVEQDVYERVGEEERRCERGARGDWRTQEEKQRGPLPGFQIAM